MEALHQVGNKSPPKPPKPYESLHLFHILRGCPLSIMASGTMYLSPNQMTPRSFTVVPGTWISCGFIHIIVSLTDVPAKSAECPAAEASLYMSTLYCQCNGLILVIWERRTGTGLGLPSQDIWWGCAGSLGEVLEKSIVAPPTWRQIDLVAQWPGVDWKKVFAKSSTAWYTPRTMAKVSKMVAIWGTTAWMRDTTVFNAR